MLNASFDKGGPISDPILATKSRTLIMNCMANKLSLFRTNNEAR